MKLSIKLPTFIESYVTDIWFVISSRVTVICFVICFILIAIKWNSLPPEVPLFYSLPWGEEQLASQLQLMLFMLGLTSLYVMTIMTSIILSRYETYYSRILLVSSALISVLGLVSVIQILFLIT